MTLIVVTPPGPVITWEEAQRHLREDGDDEKAYVEGLITAATAWIDGPAGWLGQALAPQLLEWRLCNWPDAYAGIPMGPVLPEPVVATYVDTAGVEQTIELSSLLFFGNLPAVRGRDGDIRIQYWAGYGKRDPNDNTKWIAEVPAPIKQAILLLVGQWFHTRSAVRIGDAVNQMPIATEALLAPYRVWR